MTPQEQQALDTALAVVQTVGPALGPTGALVAAGVTAAFQAFTAASNAGSDVTDEQLQAVFDKFDANAADDLAAQAEAKGKTTG